MLRIFALWQAQLAHRLPGCSSAAGLKVLYGQSRSCSQLLREARLRLPRSQKRDRPAAAASNRSSTLNSVAIAPLQRDFKRLAQEHEEYWKGAIQAVTKPTALKLLDYVDPAFLLGLPPAEQAAAKGRTGRRKGIPVLFYFKEVKRQHPTKIALVRVGEFFEAVGIDAVLLVQHAGLNPMGDGNPPRAGCPRMNLRRTVNDLLHAGLSVVVCEEVDEGYFYGYKRTNTKERYVAQILTPATPHLLYGLIDEDSDVVLDSTPPLMGISMQVGGFTVIEVNLNLYKITVTEGLTEDAVHARLYEGGLSPPLFIHQLGNVGGADLGGSMPMWERRAANIFRSQAGSVERYTGDDPVDAMLARVRSLMDVPLGAHFTVVSSGANDQPRPLYQSTASNLGLHTSRGVPALLDCMLPPNTPPVSRTWLKQLLLFPPPPRVGAAILKACSQLKDYDGPLPVFPSLGMANVVLKLTQQEANDIFFRELSALCTSVGEVCSEAQLAQLADALLVVAGHGTGISAPRDELARTCRAVLKAIAAVVEEQERIAGGGPLDTDTGESSGEDADATFEALVRLQQANENKFRGRVLNQCIQAQHDKVVSTWQEVEAAVKVMMEGLAEVAKESAPSKLGPMIVFNSYNNAVWLKVPPGFASTAQLHELGLTHPYDRMGKVEGGFYSNKDVEYALDKYRRACSEATQAVKRQLKQLSQELQAQLPQLTTACMFATIASALTAHMHEAMRRGWTLPQHLYSAEYDPRNPPKGPPPGISIEGMWPYWLEGRAQGVVPNSCNLKGMFLLTGPNMAGKSTMLRSVCAVSLLGACGLCVPAQRTAVPYLDAFMLRNFSSDSPIDGQSSFAVEMTEMRYVLNDVTQSSLVLVDELGRGTEVRAGAALAGAFLEELAAIGCKGVFATHLHVLLEMELNLPGVELMQMEVAQKEAAKQVGGLTPTWRMIPGSNRESLALDVAQACNVPQAVLHRAAGLYSHMGKMSYMAMTGHQSHHGQQAQQTQQQQQQPSLGISSPAASDSEGWLASGEGSSSESPSEGEEAPTTRSLEEAGEVLQAATHHQLLALLQGAASSSGQGTQQGMGGTRMGASAAIDQQEATLAEDRNESTAGGQEGADTSNSEALNAGGVLDQGVANQQGQQQCNGVGPLDAVASSNGSSGGAELLARHPVSVQYVRPGQDPPPKTVGATCVYVVRREDGYFYVGRTDSLKQRIAAHRRRKPSSSSRVGGGPRIQVAYVAVSAELGGASSAGAAEAAVIKAMLQEGFPLISSSDSRKKYVPKFKG